MTDLETKPKKSLKSLLIRWQDKDGQATFEPENEDRFTLRFSEVIQACQMQAKAEQYKVQFNLLLGRLGYWLNSRTEVASAFLTLRDSQLLFLVVTKSNEYDADFEDALSDLDIELANDPDLQDVGFGVLSIPNVPVESLDSFIHPTINFELSRRGEYND